MTRASFVGTIKLSDFAYVGDPCKVMDEWGFLNVLPGFYNVYAITEMVSRPMCSALVLKHVDYESGLAKRFSRVSMSDIVVESKRCGIYCADAFPFWGEERDLADSEFAKISLDARGAISRSGGGNGKYGLYSVSNDSGERVALLLDYLLTFSVQSFAFINILQQENLNEFPDPNEYEIYQGPVEEWDTPEHGVKISDAMDAIIAKMNKMLGGNA